MKSTVRIHRRTSENDDQFTLVAQFDANLVNPDLNLAPDLTEEERKQASDEYMEQAKEAVTTLPYAAIPSDTGWLVKHYVEIPNPLNLDEAKLQERIQPHIEKWDEEIQLTDDLLYVLAGWKKLNPKTKKLEDAPEKS